MSPSHESVFSRVYILHDRESTLSVAELETVLRSAHPNVEFIRPWFRQKPLVSPVAYDYFMSMSAFRSRSLVVGIGLAGLCAASMQERFPELGSSVIAIDAPTQDGILGLVGSFRDLRPTPTTESALVALYSSQYEPIKGRCDWRKHADYAFDHRAWAYGIGYAVYTSAYLISSFMRGLDLNREAARVIPHKETI